MGPWDMGPESIRQRPEALCLMSLHCPLSEGEGKSWVTELGQILRQVTLSIGKALRQTGPGPAWYR